MTKANPTKNTRWTRYQHRENPTIEYDVEEEARYLDWSSTGTSTTATAKNFQPKVYKSPDRPGELCVRLRTVKNHYLAEEVHIPAFTLMPLDRFLELYREKKKLSRVSS